MCIIIYVYRYMYIVCTVHVCTCTCIGIIMCVHAQMYKYMYINISLPIHSLELPHILLVADRGKVRGQNRWWEVHTSFCHAHALIWVHQPAVHLRYSRGFSLGGSSDWDHGALPLLTFLEVVLVRPLLLVFALVSCEEVSFPGLRPVCVCVSVCVCVCVCVCVNG